MCVCVSVWGLPTVCTWWRADVRVTLSNVHLYLCTWRKQHVSHIKASSRGIYTTILHHPDICRPVPWPKCLHFMDWHLDPELDLLYRHYTLQIGSNFYSALMEMLGEHKQRVSGRHKGKHEERQHGILKWMPFYIQMHEGPIILWHLGEVRKVSLFCFFFNLIILYFVVLLQSVWAWRSSVWSNLPCGQTNNLITSWSPEMPHPQGVFLVSCHSKSNEQSGEGRYTNEPPIKQCWTNRWERKWVRVGDKDKGRSVIWCILDSVLHSSASQRLPWPFQYSSADWICSLSTNQLWEICRSL